MDDKGVEKSMQPHENEFKIRQLSQEDLDAIKKINLGSWSGFTTSELLEDVTTFVAELEGRVVGYAAAQFEIKEDTSEVGIVSYNAVLPDARGFGIGSALIDKVIQHLKDQGARVLLVWTLEVGESARHIYEKIGFTELTRFVYYSMEV
jgi:GNAT superfamily N-acetyltransferase